LKAEKKLKAPFSPMLPEGSQVSLVCPSGKGSFKMKMQIEHWWNYNDWINRSTQFQ